MYYNKFKYQEGGRTDFLYDLYTKLAKSGLIGNMRFNDFASLPSKQQEQLVQQLTSSNLNQYRYGGRYKAQTNANIGNIGGAIAGNVGNALNKNNNQGNAANSLFSWGKDIAGQNITGLAGTGASMIGNLIADDKEAYTPQGAIGNAISGIGTGVASGAAFGPIGAVIGGGLGLVKSIVESVQADEKKNEEIKDSLKPRQMGESKSSYNPELKYFRYGGSSEMENAYAKSRANLQPNEYSFSGKGKINIDSDGIKRAGYQVGGNTEMREYPQYRGQDLPFKYFNEYQMGGRFKPQYELQDGGEAEVEVESGEAIMADPRGLTLHGGAYSENESPVGMMVRGAEHGEKNLAGTEGIPVSFNNPNMNPDGAFVYSKYLTPDGRLAKGKGDTPRDSVAGKVKPLLKFAENAMSTKSNDRYYNNPAVLEAIQEEMQYIKDEALRGKFMHGLDKLLKKKNRSFNEILDYIKNNNPATQTETIEGIGSVEGAKEFINNQQPDPNSQMLEQVKNQTLSEVNQDRMNIEQINPKENMMMKDGGQLPQDILEARMRASGASENEINDYVQRNYKKGGWIQEATASIKKRGTEGVCTGSKFGGPTCPPGSKRYNLAKTFRKMANSKQEGGYLNPYYSEDDYDDIEDEYIYRNGGYAEPEYYGYKPTGGVDPEGYYVGGYVDKMVYGRGGHIGYMPTSGNPEGYPIGGYENRMAYGFGGKYLEEGGHIGYLPESYSVAPEGYYIGGYIDKTAYRNGGQYRRFMQQGDQIIPLPVSEPTEIDMMPIEDWDDWIKGDSYMRQSIHRYLDQHNNLRKNQKEKPLDFNKRPTDPNELKQWNNILKDLRKGIDEHNKQKQDPKLKNYPSTWEQEIQMKMECPEYLCPPEELVMKRGGYMRRYRQAGGPMIPTYQDAWRSRQYSQPVNKDYYGESSNITANTTTPYQIGGEFRKALRQPISDMDKKVMNYRSKAADIERQKQEQGKIPGFEANPNLYYMFDKDNFNYLEKPTQQDSSTYMQDYEEGKTMSQRERDQERNALFNLMYNNTFNAYNKDRTPENYKRLSNRYNAITESNIRETGGMMGDNSYMGYSRNQSLYGGMINTNTSPFWAGYKTKAQEGMEMEQPQGNAQLAQARQQMLANRPSAQPMMEEDMMMEEELPAGSEEMMLAEKANQQRSNPLAPIMQVLPDWFKSPNDPKGLGIFSQSAVAALRENGFDDKSISQFNPNRIQPSDPIVEFLVREAQGMMEEKQKMQQPQQMGRGGMMHYTYPEDYKSGIRKQGGSVHNLKRGQYVKFQQGGNMYEGVVKYYDPITGNFELDDNY